MLMMTSLRFVPRWFGSEAIGELPFEPPSLLRRVTQRGLTDAAPREYGALFIYLVCQGSVRTLVTKMVGVGPGRVWSQMQPEGIMARFEKKNA